ncbi:MAG: hypothetical protein BM555_01235 [Crocinitomix sp. MedPE-SWsnd]|nr:MAG: hypothetical protein BM555_01235 [Crocinitomix sp. MedPE-SWsnd]
MDHKIVIEYQAVVKELEVKFGEGLELDAILLLVGIQELGKGYEEFSKDEKMNLMHIAICTILEPFGYYKFVKDDEDGWPHFDKVENLPALKPKEQEYLLKEAITQYFRANDYL